VLLAWLAGLPAGCQYAKDRALDYLDPLRFVVGAGTPIGVRTSANGLYDTGLMIGAKPRATALGWNYGTPLILDRNDAHLDVDQAQIVQATSVRKLDFEHGDYASARSSFALLPALFSWVDATPTTSEWVVPDQGADFEDSRWIWSANDARTRYAQVHAFDVEVGLACFVYLDVGFSPGEFLDFLLGFFLIDIAGDDGRL